MKLFLAGLLAGIMATTLTVIAPQQASEKVVEPQVLVENHKVKIVRWLLAPGEGTPLHTHTLNHVSVVIRGSSIRDVQANGATKVQEQKSGQTTFVPGTGRTHSFANVGETTFESVAIELK